MTYDDFRSAVQMGRRRRATVMTLPTGYYTTKIVSVKVTKRGIKTRVKVIDDTKYKGKIVTVFTSVPRLRACAAPQAKTKRPTTRR